MATVTHCSGEVVRSSFSDARVIYAPLRFSEGNNESAADDTNGDHDERAALDDDDAAVESRAKARGLQLAASLSSFERMHAHEIADEVASHTLVYSF